MNDHQFRRVDRDEPCLVCGHTTWCLRATDDSASLCPRICEGAVGRLGDAGWLHLHRKGRGRRVAPRRRVVLSRPTTPGPGLAGLALEFSGAVDPGRLSWLAAGLGVSRGSLVRLGVGWCEASKAWSFPMTDSRGRLLGFRLRTEAGRKFAVRGGHEGLFIPDGPAGGGPLLVCEGPTDTAAVLDLAFDAVGRPNCSGGRGLLADLVAARKPAWVVIVADGDGPGISGGHALAASLCLRHPGVKVIGPPHGIKDIRAWKRAGASRQDLLDAIGLAIPQRVSVSVRGPVTAPAGGGRRAR